MKISTETAGEPGAIVDRAAGRHARSPTEIPASGWKAVAVRTWKQAGEDNLGLVAAGVAFYAFLALIPLLGSIVLTYGLIATPQTVQSNVQSLAAMMPAEAAKLIGEQLTAVIETSGGKKGLGLLLALAIALFGARNAAGSVITALNIAYEEEETRGFIKVNLLALAITAIAVILAIVAMGAVAALGHLETLLPGLPGALLVFGKILSYGILLAGASASAATLFRYAPDRKKAKWLWITSGSIFAAVGWIILTLGFGFYAANFGNYGKTYGSLATVVVLLTWVYLSAYILLFGAELNSELEHQTVEDTTEGPAKPLGQRDAWSADHVASDASADASVPAKSDAPPVEQSDLPRPSGGHPYLASRAAARVGRVAGGAKVGMIGSALATVGLGMLRRPGRARAGTALLVGAALLSILHREDDER